MKIRIVGGPIAATAKVFVEVEPSLSFSAMMPKIEEAAGVGSLSGFSLQICEVVDKKVKPVALAEPSATPASAKLPTNGTAILMLKSGAGGSTTPRGGAGSPTAASPPPVPPISNMPSGQQRSFRDRVKAFYEKYEPSKVSSVDATVEKFKGQEDAVIATLIKKYGPEPLPDDSAPSSPTPGAAATTLSTPASPRSYRERVLAMYQKYDPAKAGQVDATLAKFAGKEEAVIATLVKKYGPEPSSDAAASPAPSIAPSEDPASPITAASPSPSAASPPASQPEADGTNAAPAPHHTYRDRVLAIYEKYEPAKVGTVDATLAKFRGKEESVIATLVKKYGPEPLQAPTPRAEPLQPPKVPPIALKSVTEAAPAAAAPPSYRERVLAMYQKYDPPKVGTVDATLAKFTGKEEAVIATLVKKYGPEPTPTGTPRDVSTPPHAPTPDAPSTPRKLSHRERVLAMYQKYDPAKVGTVDATLAKFAGKEEAVIATLVKKYGPEPTPSAVSIPTPPPQSAPPAPEPIQPPPSGGDSPAAPASLSAVDSNPTPLSSAAATPIDTPRGAVPDERPQATVTARAVSFIDEQRSTAKPPVTSAPSEGGDSHNRRSEDALRAAARLKVRWSRLRDCAVAEFLHTKVEAPHRSRALAVWRHVTLLRATVREARQLVADGVWIEEGGGIVRLAGSANPPMRVPDLPAKLLEWRRASVLTGDEARLIAIRALAAVRVLANDVPPRAPIAPESAVALLERACADAAHRLPALEAELAASQAASQQLSERVAAKDADIAQLAGLLDQTASLAQRYEEVSRERAALAAERDAADAANKKAQQDLETAKLELHRTKVALQNERRGVPTDLEAQLLAKDASIASLHQQLAKLRTLHRATREQEQQLRQQLDSVMAMSSGARGGGAYRERSSSRERVGPSGTTPRLLLSGSGTNNSSPPQYDDVRRQKEAAALVLIRSSQRRHPSPRDAEFEPEETRSRDSDDDASGHLATDPLSPPAQPRWGASRDGGSSIAPNSDGMLPPLPDRGPCPTCDTALTAFYGEQYGATEDDASKVAFCFSCRRSFTAKDLKIRDQQQRNKRYQQTAGAGLARPRTPR